MARPTIALQKTKQLQRSLSAISATPLRSPNLALPATFLTPHIASTPTRPFHSTQATRAKPAPKAARKKRDREYENAHTQSWDRAGRPYYRVDQDGLSYIMGKPGHVESTVKDVSLLCPIMYTAGIRDGIIPKSISLKKFEEVLTALTRAWFEDIPNANAITSISSDVDAVWRIGFMMTYANQGTAIRTWILHSCARAKAKIPMVLVAWQQLRDDTVPKDTKWNVEVAKLAAQGFPPAMLLQTKILSLRGKIDEALELLTSKIMPNLVSTRDRPNPMEDITLTKQIESPFRLGALLYASLAARLEAQGKPGAQELFEKADEWTKKAALEYNDVEALVDYASLMMNEKNYDMYEECMSKAATGGSGKACFFLANFYFRTSLGEFPMRNQRALPNYTPNDRSTWALESEEAGKTAIGRFWKWWAAPIETSRDEYKHLAFEWYQTAVEYTDYRAGMMAALLFRDDEQYSQGKVWIQMLLDDGLGSDKEYGPKAIEIVKHWDDINYEPAIPKRLLPVR